MKSNFWKKCITGMMTGALLLGMSTVAFADDTWKMFNESDPNLSFIGEGWYAGHCPYSTDDKVYCNLTEGAEYRFNFTGTKLKITTPQYYDCTSQMIIDGVMVIPSNYVNDLSAVKYLVTDLSNTEHSVRVVSLKNNSSIYNWITPDKIEIASDGKMLPYNGAASTVKTKIINIEPEKSKIRVNDTVKAKVVIDNISEIAAEDIRITYDATKLKFEGYEEASGIKLVKNLDKEGELRVIVASLGKDQIVNAKKVLLNLKFRGISVGEAKVDVIKARVSDGLEMEKDLTDEECGEATIIIEAPIFLDVNKSGEFTLLDLAIDARHFAKDPKLAELLKYNTDVVVNNNIDDADLLEIGQQMLSNVNYKF